MIAFIHTSPSMIPVFKGLADELLTGKKIFNVVDESLLCDIIGHGCCPPATWLADAIAVKASAAVAAARIVERMRTPIRRTDRT